jgi:hypothetical protein
VYHEHVAECDCVRTSIVALYHCKRCRICSVIRIKNLVRQSALYRAADTRRWDVLKWKRRAILEVRAMLLLVPEAVNDSCSSDSVLHCLVDLGFEIPR